MSTHPHTRDALAVTIDGPDSRDLDDAVYVVSTHRGWNVTVYVADVAAAVPLGSPEDVAARARAATVYHARGSDPMLPRHLAESDLSLLPDVPRGALAVDIEVRADGAPDVVSLRVGCVRSRAKLAHADVPRILGDPKHALHGDMAAAHALARHLAARRRFSGALVFYGEASGIATTEEGALRVVRGGVNAGYVIVQELMVLANCAVARWCVERSVHALFRNHCPSEAAPHREAVQRDIEAVASGQAPFEPTDERLGLLLGRASYGPHLHGHWGLSVAAYAHFTSPIRRYADLALHRQVRAYLTGEPPPLGMFELAEVARSINATINARKDATRERHRARAGREALQAAAAGALADAPDHVLERALKLALADDDEPGKGLANAVLARCHRGDFPLICAALVVTRSPADAAWDPLRRAVVESLSRAPHDAATVLAYGPNVTAGWPAVTYDVREVPDGDGRPFGVTASSGRVDSPRCRARSKKEASQRAAVELLRVLVGLPPSAGTGSEVSPPAPSALASPAASTPVGAAPPVAGGDPVSVLNQWCQHNALAAPTYVFDSSGAAHAPTFTAACRVKDVVGRGEGRSKQEAKRSAAEDAVALLRAT